MRQMPQVKQAKHSRYKYITAVIAAAVFFQLMPGGLLFGHSRQTGETDALAVYKEAKRAIYRKDWARAIGLLERFESISSPNRYVAEPFYWLAYSRNKLADQSESVQQKIDLKKEALEGLDRLVNEYRHSGWVEVSKTLRVKIAADLVKRGIKRYMSYILQGLNSSNVELKVVALDALLQTDKENALPVVEEILKAYDNPELVDKCVFVLRKYKDQRIIALLENFKKEPSDTTGGPLPYILEKTAHYCDALKKDRFRFSCRERVEESVKRAIKFSSEKAGLRDFLSGYKMVWDSVTGEQGMQSKAVGKAIWKIEALEDYNIRGKNKYLARFNITMEGGRIKEKRTLLEINGKKVSNEKEPPKTLYYPYRNSLYPVTLFSREMQKEYSYKLLRTEYTMKRRAYVVAAAKKDNGEKRLATAWIDAADFSIFKIKVFPEAFGGYKYLLRTGAEDVANIKINDVHYYENLKFGIRFPSKTELTLTFDGPDNSETQYETVMNTAITATFLYEKYTFFKR